MTDNYFDAPEEVTDALQDGMTIGGAIELPFNAPYFWWMNGTPQLRGMKETAPALYYGGWSADEEAWEAGVEEYKALRGIQIPLADLTSRGGRDYKAYVTRYLFVAPISYRAAWVVTDDATGQTMRHTHYIAGARHHVQLLALLANKDKDTYAPWGPVVLSAKGYQAQKLLDAAKEWDKQLSKMRRQHAPKIPAYGFWMCLGTFGADIVTEQVGKGNSKSPITPLTMVTPKEITLDLLKKLYVGSAGLTIMAEYLADAKQWLEAWKARDTDKQAQAPADDGIPEEPEFPPMEDSIPF